MKVYVIGILICLQISVINYSVSQGLECKDQLSYEVIEENNGAFDIEVRLKVDSKNDFLLKLYSVSDQGEFISEVSVNKSKSSITFKGLSNKKVYLIQAISDDCTVTLGGMEGIKVEKE
jgi:hypothetical protein